MGLAPLVVLELFDVVRQLASDGITIVLAEQFVHTALSLATQGAIVVHGRVGHTGSTGRPPSCSSRRLYDRRGE